MDKKDEDIGNSELKTYTRGKEIISAIQWILDEIFMKMMTMMMMMMVMMVVVVVVVVMMRMMMMMTMMVMMMMMTMTTMRVMMLPLTLTSNKNNEATRQEFFGREDVQYSCVALFPYL